MSPDYLGGGAHMTRTDSPHGIALNPASAAGFQRMVLDASYFNLQGLGDMKGMGHAANLGLAIPTRRGVWTGSMNFVDTSAYAESAMDLGMAGSLNIAFSKEIYSDTWFGFGLAGDLGQLDGSLQGGAALNIGFLHYPKSFKGLKNFSWGGSLNGLGYRYGSSSRGYFNAIPGNITPSMGIAFDIISGEKVRLALRSDVRAPSVTDLWFGISTDLYLGSSARLSLSSSLTVRDALAGSWQTLIPAASLGFNFNLGGAKEGKRIQTTELDVSASAAPLYNGVWAFGAGIRLPFGVKDTNPPELALEIQEPIYISPNYDGTQDELIIPYTVNDERFITTYKWYIADSKGSEVRGFVNKDERPENESLQNLWARLIALREGTPLPDVLRWDGITQTGSISEDGEYEVFIQFSDDNGNTVKKGPFTVVVDTVPPNLELNKPEGLDLIFSPDGDSHKDTFPLAMEGSEEHLWQAEFQDAAGNAVISWDWSDKVPEKLDWDGIDELGSVIPDGVYRYTVHATDLAGNSYSDAIEGIIVDTQRPEIGLNISKAVFSPGTASTVSSIELRPDIPVSAGIVDWSLDIIGSDGQSKRVWTRTNMPQVPQTLVFDGKGGGEWLPEGNYSGRLNIEYSNGYKTTADSPSFAIDTTPPQAKVSANWNLFSPQGSSRRGTVTFSQDSSEEKTWRGIIVNSKDEVIKEWSWIAQPEPFLTWDGRSKAGRLVPDGKYYYFLSAVDEAGNYGASDKAEVTVDTSTATVSLTASLDVFGPTGNGRKDEVSFFMGAQEKSPIADWRLQVTDSSGRERMLWTGKGNPPEGIQWRGTDSQGKKVEDGPYTGKFTVNYVRGDAAEARSSEVSVDTQPPNITISADYTLFSPDGDKQRDAISIKQQSSREDGFEANLYDAKNKVVRTWLWKGTLQSFEWNGTDASGNTLPDGSYRYEVAGLDKAGNETRREIKNIRIDTAATPVYLTAKESYIKAGETDPERYQTFTAIIPNLEGMASWQFAIEDESGKQVYSRSDAGKVPALSWNGMDNKGKPVEGSFKGALIVSYEKGSRPRAESRAFISDGSPPVLNVTVSPQPFSPDDDNVDDEAVLNLTVEDSSRIGDWSLDIFDTRNRKFITFSGSGRPSERIIWDGRSGKGELVESAEDYPFILKVSDILGNSAEKKGKIAVDVLVIREGNRLRIRINNITFQPNSPALTLTGDEGAKNKAVLNRLAEIMKKYSGYRIVVEGHAVSLKWDNPAAAKREQDSILLPLSQKRSQTVVNELTRRGIAASRLVAEGVGGSKPIVPHGDTEERWRNRRVEFYLEK
ncbi:MAG: hypothetical protein B0D92_03020 [Spirochaeta sp. LUC14_002_19_P3]|nr:MAG: hypothetical protein B0D92_03020 [Spirochaeta sp. LUC14_002_19_P3]